jgi:hypothetical protein
VTHTYFFSLPCGSRNSQDLAGDISLRQVTSLTATETSSTEYIFAHTLHAHLHTTPADTVHTPHTDEWLVECGNGFHNHRDYLFLEWLPRKFENSLHFLYQCTFVKEIVLLFS